MTARKGFLFSLVLKNFKNERVVFTTKEQIESSLLLVQPDRLRDQIKPIQVFCKIVEVNV